ncbi:hypothetical protein Lal_00019822 [Lupinus albus]|uniref:Putative 3'(2'),5'-bisphosphate nucleotidase n=1 Tax=Lupinus albus TaxID=3870 RepID=A0A6A4R3Y5_LUPAL|nr:putative 3'(2'),5'-bisphosphate nucleotidase [Lupinus albus]KAF1899692.1 hypothetical protein Lal_00019822 [Lupinus albus]
MEEENDKYARELEVAVRVVHVACALCGRVQEKLLATTNDLIVSKDDDSLVTVADLSVQATVSVVIVEEAGGVVTDAGGPTLDFSKGMYLEGLDRGIVACSGVRLHEKLIDVVYASWDSSNL